MASSASPLILGPRELQLLRLCWQHGPASVRELRDHLEQPPAYTTVLGASSLDGG